MDLVGEDENLQPRLAEFSQPLDQVGRLAEGDVAVVVAVDEQDRARPKIDAAAG